MDFRMEKSSWLFLLVMLSTMVYFILEGASFSVGFGGFLQALLFGLLTVFALVALMSIPVLIYCYIVKKIPDIDYSINAAFGITVIGIISEIIF